jgi:hypothetical protein
MPDDAPSYGPFRRGPFPAGMRSLQAGEQAHLFTRGLTLAHFDATLRESEEARQFFARGASEALVAHGVDAFGPRS